MMNIHMISDFSEFFLLVDNLHILIFSIFCAFERYPPILK